jgi:hypothetical protein
MNQPIAFSRRGLHALGVLAVLSGAFWAAVIWAAVVLVSR